MRNTPLRAAHALSRGTRLAHPGSRRGLRAGRSLRGFHARPGQPARRSLLSALAAALLVSGLALAGAVGLSAPANAAAQVSIQGSDDLDPDGETQLRLSGSGFQSVQNGFGGIYVLFGWASDSSGGSWKPSQGGQTGSDYRYVYDDETNPEGFQLFVNFPGSSTSAAANGGQLNADGTWEATIRIPGAVFETYDRAQNVTTVDCTEQQCGIMTIGAHGVVNENNESFTPVSFAAGSGGGGDDGGGEAAAAEEAEDSEAPAASEDADAATEEAPEEAAPAAGPAPAADDSDILAQPTAVDPALLEEQQRQTLLMSILLAVGIILGLCVIGLSFGIGGYLAAKALLLGVNPEALEKVRAKREARAVRAEAKRRRRISAVRRREEIRSQKTEARNGGRVARASMAGDGAAAGAGASAHTGDEALMRFFSGETDVLPSSANGAAQWSTGETPVVAEDGADTQALAPWGAGASAANGSPGGARDGAGGGAGGGSVGGAGGAGEEPESRDPEARTTVLTHVQEESR